MPPKVPTKEVVKEMSDHFGFELSEGEVVEYQSLIEASMQAYKVLDQYDDVRLPVKYPRKDVGYRPTGDENPSNGWVWKCEIEGAQGGILQGKKIGIKDNIMVAGVPMLNGSSIMEGFVPIEDATVVTRLLDAGATIAGKTGVPAFCFDGGGCTGYPDPQPENPHDSTRMAGSSSNGSAVVVVTGQADMAIGGDQGGSVRLPASWSGCFGLKPTKGLVPYTGAFPIEQTIDHLGPMANSAFDCGLLLQVIAGTDDMDPRQRDVTVKDYVSDIDKPIDGLRIGVVKEGFAIEGLSEDDVDAAVHDAALAFKKLGAQVETVSIPMHSHGQAIWAAVATEGATDLMIEGGAYGSNWMGHYSTSLMNFYSVARKQKGKDYSETVKLTAMTGHYMSKNYNRHYYAKAQNLARVLSSQYDDALKKFDILVMPTTPMKAQQKPASQSPSEIVAKALGNIYNTSPFNLTGHPAISVPVSNDSGLPIGMMLIGRHWEDDVVLKAAHQFESKG